MPEALSDGIRISFDDHGRGEPALLFMPGWCGSRRVFDELARRCAQWRRTLAIDWRGHGRSAKPASISPPIASEANLPASSLPKLH
ncbi:alpha/beta fold hydrolase [Pelomicrobium methylotrophicum]|uniref:alpha/beta fold hydrolase n=1 Tax=Pelomicrobium methylotrophicum TaxID=2602750 RepID=UPI003CC94A1C